MSITEFLEARIAEDEAQAEYVQSYGDCMTPTGGYALFTPHRVLAECAAKRAIIGWWTNGVIGEVEVDGELTNPLLPLAAVYADHRDYQQEWALGDPR